MIFSLVCVDLGFGLFSTSLRTACLSNSIPGASPFYSQFFPARPIGASQCKKRFLYPTRKCLTFKTIGCVRGIEEHRLPGCKPRANAKHRRPSPGFGQVLIKSVTSADPLGARSRADARRHPSGTILVAYARGIVPTEFGFRTSFERLPSPSILSIQRMLGVER